MTKKTKSSEQINFWKGEFGDNYTIRNSGNFDKMYQKLFGISRTTLNNKFLSRLNKDSKILEIGCNRGIQLQILRKMGFSNLTGIEINKSAIMLARKNKEFCIMEANAFDIPFKDNFFDLVFTSGVLIHIAPENLEKAMKEMVRVSRKYIFGAEYYSEKCEAIEYRGNKNKLWRNNFPKLFLKYNPNLRLINSKKLTYLDDSKKFNVVYLFEKI